MALGLNGEYWNVVFGVEKGSVIQFGRGRQLWPVGKNYWAGWPTWILD